MEYHLHLDIVYLIAKLQLIEAHEPLHNNIGAKKAKPANNAICECLRRLQCWGDRFDVRPLGDATIEDGKELYDMRAKESVKEGGEVKCLLWYQRETTHLLSNFFQVRSLASFINHI